MKNTKKRSATINLSLVLLLMFIPVFIATASAEDYDGPSVPDLSTLEVWSVQEPLTTPVATYDTHVAAYVEGYGVVRVPVNTPTMAISETMGSNVPSEIGEAIVNSRPVNRVLSDEDLINNAGTIPVEFNRSVRDNPGLADIKFVGEYFGQHPDASPAYVFADSIFAYCAGPDGMKALGYELTTLTGTQQNLDGTLTPYEYQAWQRTNTRP